MRAARAWGRGALAGCVHDTERATARSVERWVGAELVDGHLDAVERFTHAASSVVAGDDDDGDLLGGEQPRLARLHPLTPLDLGRVHS